MKAPQNAHKLSDSKKRLIVGTDDMSARPGLGFHFIERKVAPNSIYKKIDQCLESKDFLSSAKICDFIENKVQAFETSDFRFNPSDDFSVDVKHINSFVEMNEFLGENGVITMNRILNPQGSAFPREIEFKDAFLSFFVKADAVSGTWGLAKTRGPVDHGHSDEFSFRQKFGDTLITEVRFGANALFRVDVRKDRAALESKGFVLDSLKCLGAGELSFEQKKSVCSRLAHKVSVIAVSLISHNAVILDNADLESMIDYMDKLPLIAAKKPRVVAVTTKFYDSDTISPDRLEGYRETILDFEKNAVGKGLDLYQCAQYYGSVLGEGGPRAESYLTAEKTRDECMVHLDSIKTFVDDLQTSCWSSHVPSVPSAEEVVEKFAAGDPISISTKMAALNSENFRGGPNILALEIKFSNMYSLCLQLYLHSKQYENKKGGVPDYVLGVSESESSDELPLLVDLHKAGRGSLMFLPSSPAGFKNMFALMSRDNQGQHHIPLYIKVYNITNASLLSCQDPIYNFGAANKPYVKFRQSHGPSSASRIDPHTFLFHKDVPTGATDVLEKSTQIVNVLTDANAASEQNTANYIVKAIESVRKVNIALKKYNANTAAYDAFAAKIARYLADLFEWGPQNWSPFLAQSEPLLKALSAEVAVMKRRMLLELLDGEAGDLAKWLNAAIDVLRGIIEFRKEADECFGCAAKEMWAWEAGNERERGKIADAKKKLWEVWLCLKEERNDLNIVPTTLKKGKLDEATFKMETVWKLVFDSRWKTFEHNNGGVFSI